MALCIGNKKLSGLTVTNEIGLDTYDADITPENMQHDTVAYAKGERVIGTGRCFEKAGYGQGTVLPLTDMDGNERMGLSIFTRIKPNILFLASTGNGDIVCQTMSILELSENEATEIGFNHTATGNVNAYHDGSFLHIFFENIEDTETRLLYFYGKDNKI